VSKYRIHLSYSPYRVTFNRVTLSALLLVVLQYLPSSLLTWIDETTVTALTLPPLLIWIGLSYFCQSTQSNSLNQLDLMLSDEGVVHIVDGVSCDKFMNLIRKRLTYSQTGDIFQLHGASQLYPWGMSLEMTRVKRKWSDKGYAHFCWVLKNECSERDYRRLCRAVIYVRKGYGLRDKMNVS
jgi:hypothetical protein